MSLYVQITIIMKTRFFQILFLPILTALLVSCSEREPDYIESTTGTTTVSVPATVKVGELFNVDLNIVGSSGCSEFSRFTTTQVGDTTIFELFQRRDKGLICTDATINIEEAISISYETSGVKVLKFNESSIFSDFTPILIESVTVEQ